MISGMNRFSQAHERLKQSIHTYWRQNRYLSPRSTAGKVVMSCVYFSLPVAIGYYISTAAVEMSESTIEERFGNKYNNNNNNNNNRSLPDDRSSREEDSEDKLFGIGVHLVTSDQETQEINRINLERFLKKQRRLKEKREREREEAAQATANNNHDES
ncbi:hypothetical protein IV203_002057 [Nitzschia inconspicua]|uniref:Uncharacterized protein n=1 Tax=Nitzschia inconspicua TaxID=303405 RepID=A0A9K3L8U3_9STRA|nr:hypothetical protein IV203_002057 [Nitzschia inconspicua]